MISSIYASQLGIRVTREMPRDADTVAHAWLVRGGYLYQHAAGIYCFSPLLYRVEQKVSSLIADEITREGGSQLRLPILQSADLWKKSGRWDVYKHERLMFQLHDRKGREFGLSPTAEEVVCDMAKQMVSSATQLPMILFQQNLKFRDEMRPRSGLLRTREFIMMDAYSFDEDEEGLSHSYQKMRRAYHAIFGALGLKYITVDADSGSIGGASSEEFMSISEIGEDIILYNDEYAANVEQACSTLVPAVTLADAPVEVIGDYASLEQAAKAHGVDKTAILNAELYTLYYADNKQDVLVLLRGDSKVNTVKLANYFNALEVQAAGKGRTLDTLGVSAEFVGPVDSNSDLVVIADHGLKGLSSMLSGCNQEDKFALYVCPGRDFPLPNFADIREAVSGEDGPNGQPLKQCKGVEIGHIFKLGDKYSTALGAGVYDKQQQYKPLQMGCYGIGTTRVIQAVVDQNCDAEKGIVWPMVVAPFHVHILPLKSDYLHVAKELSDQLEGSSVEALIDDRSSSAGSLMKDSDILGIPLRIVIGRDYSEGKVEVLNRLSGEKYLVDIARVAEKITTIVLQEHEAALDRKLTKAHQ